MTENNHVETKAKSVEVVSPTTAAALLPVQAERITELRSEVAALKSSRFSISLGSLVVGTLAGFGMAAFLLPPKERVVQIPGPTQVIEKPVTVDRWCLVACK